MVKFSISNNYKTKTYNKYKINKFFVYKNYNIIKNNCFDNHNSCKNIIKFKVQYENMDKINQICNNKNKTNTKYNKKSKRSSSYKGVSKNGKKWQVLLNSNRKKFYLGCYYSEKTAAKIYDYATINLKGKNANTNFFYNNDEFENLKNIIKLKSTKIY